MRYPKNNKELYIANRSNLVEKSGSKNMILITSSSFKHRNGDQFFPYRQDSNFYYLTGIEQEGCTLLLCPDHPVESMREMLFMKIQSKKEIIYDGKRLDEKTATELSGIKNILPDSQFDRMFKEAMYFSKDLLMSQNEYSAIPFGVDNANVSFAEKIKKEFPAMKIDRLEPFLTELRLVKAPEELEIMQHACDITEKAFHRILRFVKPGTMEYLVEAEMTHEFIKNRANGHAYQPIIASGINACTLHYIKNSEECKDGDLLLMDFGAEYSNYASDCTRTIPVNGRFSPRQRGVYQAVLNVFNEAKNLFVPGTTIAEIDQKVAKLMEKELVELGLFNNEDLKNQNPNAPLYREYLPHGIAHFIGLDVHDVGSKYIPLKEGMVLTCEPGIYIHEENIGIRLENNIVVAKEPIDLMENIPIEIDDIERLMGKNRYKED